MSYQDARKVLGDTSVKIMHYLIDPHGFPTTVQVMSDHIGIEQSAVSHTLAHMKKAGIVKSQRNGKSTKYKLTSPSIVIKVDEFIRDVNEWRRMYGN